MEHQPAALVQEDGERRAKEVSAPEVVRDAGKWIDDDFPTMADIEAADITPEERRGCRRYIKRGSPRSCLVGYLRLTPSKNIDIR
ncbi:MAG: hypothetical protein ACREON_11975 [Gemmatimonadaceae bacterium]